MRVVVVFFLLAACVLAQVSEEDPEYESLQAQFLRAHSHKFYDPENPQRELACMNIAGNAKPTRWSCYDKPAGVAHAAVGIHCGIYTVYKDVVFGKHCTVTSYYGTALLVDGVSDAVIVPEATDPVVPEEDPPSPDSDANATAPGDTAEAPGDTTDDGVPDRPEDPEELDEDSTGDDAGDPETPDEEEPQPEEMPAEEEPQPEEDETSDGQETNSAPPPMSTPRRLRRR